LPARVGRWLRRRREPGGPDAVSAALVLDALEVAAVLCTPDGLVAHANAAASRLVGASPVDTRAFAAAVEPGVPASVSATLDALRYALSGRRAGRILSPSDWSDVRRTLRVDASPVTWPDGRRGALLIVHDLTELDAQVGDAARFDGASKTARAIAHSVNNDLAAVIGYGELLASSASGEAAGFLEQMLAGAQRAATTITRLQGLRRFRETRELGLPMLDLDASVDAVAEQKSDRLPHLRF
jgi:signal transduction histidine kinase